MLIDRCRRCHAVNLFPCSKEHCQLRSLKRYKTCRITNKYFECRMCNRYQVNYSTLMVDDAEIYLFGCQPFSNLLYAFFCFLRFMI